MADVHSIAVGILNRTYEEVSARGRYAGDDPDRLAQACSDALNDLAQHRRIVAFALCDFFITLSKRFDRVTAGGISWPQLDAAIFEAVRYVQNGSTELDAIRITDAVNMARLEWVGE